MRLLKFILSVDSNINENVTLVVNGFVVRMNRNTFQKSF